MGIDNNIAVYLCVHLLPMQDQEIAVKQFTVSRISIGADM